MGIDYAFQVYAHRRDAGRLLAALAGICDPQGHERTTVTVDDGCAVVLPAPLNFETGREVALADLVTSGYRASLGLSLCFPPDGPLRRYRDDHPDVDYAQPWPDGTTRIRVGYVYLDVHDAASLRPDHLRFEFTPATSTQSGLFLSSPSVRRTFAALASAAASPLCLFDVEQAHHLVVSARGVLLDDPWPGLLWDRDAPPNQAHGELVVRLAQQPTAAKWIIGPDEPEHREFVDGLRRVASARAPRTSI